MGSGVKVIALVEGFINYYYIFTQRSQELHMTSFLTSNEKRLFKSDDKSPKARL